MWGVRGGGLGRGQTFCCMCEWLCVCVLLWFICVVFERLIDWNSSGENDAQVC